MHAAMDIGVIGRREIAHPVQHLPRLLRRSRIVEIDELLAIDLAAEDFEIPAHGFGIEPGANFRRRAHAAAPACISAASTTVHTAPRTASFSICETASSRKARIRQPARLGFGNAARAQIEQQLGIQIADRRAMGAFHIVGEDDEFGFQIGLGLPVQQQGLGGLAAIGAVRALLHCDAALINRPRFAGHDKFEKLRTLGVADGMGEPRRHIGVAAARKHLHAGEIGFGLRALKRDVEFEPRQPGAQIGDMGAIGRTGGLRHRHLLHLHGLGGALRQPHMGQHGLLAQHDLDTEIGETRRIGMAFQQAQRRAVFQHDQHAAVMRRRRHEIQLHRLFDHHARGHAQRHAARHQRQRGRGHAVLARVAQMRPHPVRRIRQIGQIEGLDRFRHIGQRRRQLAVAQLEPRAGNVGKRVGNARRCHRRLGRQRRAQIRIFPVLVTAMRHALGAVLRQRRLAARVQPRRTAELCARADLRQHLRGTCTHAASFTISA